MKIIQKRPKALNAPDVSMRTGAVQTSGCITQHTRTAFVLFACWLFSAQSVFETAFAANPSKAWDVAVLFLSADEPDEFQEDIDRNILELARLRPGAQLNLSILRDFADSTTTYSVNAESTELTNWDDLFFKSPYSGLKIPGKLTKIPREDRKKSSLDSLKTMQAFFKQAFPNPAARRLLVLYGHGEAFDGLRVKQLPELNTILNESIPRRAGGHPIDLLWFDACFMANLESVWETQELAPIIVASQDAEFSSGAPFDTFRFLGTTEVSTEKIANDLAMRFLESYSTLLVGSQRKYVYESAATISVIQTKKLKPITLALQKWKASLSHLNNEQRRFFDRVGPHLQMERNDLVDLGSLIALIHDKRFLFPRNESIEFLYNALQARRRGERHTNSRLFLTSPKPSSLLVFGYDNWSRGFEGDTDTLTKLPRTLTPTQYVTGPNGKRWPAVKIARSSLLAPFTVGHQRFDFFYADESTLAAHSRPQSFERTSDLFTFTSLHPDQPVLLHGYTQGKGYKAEIYSGLTILDPAQGITSLDYFNTRFFKDTGWGASW